MRRKSEEGYFKYSPPDELKKLQKNQGDPEAKSFDQSLV